MNINSSRSHLIFEIKNTFWNEKDTRKRNSSLVLIDLAGSERIKESEVQGIRLVESK